ncbi:MAG: hypothetical protein DLM72_10875 [Candidatus Nitrosopolaris wilkensis]|nr:MAG: hypothetical protein DLM72_10875 [Candidatus Nitrosopolaris wilkensis]
MGLIRNERRCSCTCIKFGVYPATIEMNK